MIADDYDDSCEWRRRGWEGKTDGGESRSDARRCREGEGTKQDNTQKECRKNLSIATPKRLTLTLKTTEYRFDFHLNKENADSGRPSLATN